MTPKQIELARTAVAAKVAYWDAIRAFELSTTGGGDWEDRVDEKVTAIVEDLAICAGDTADDPEFLNDAAIVFAFNDLLEQQK